MRSSQKKMNINISKGPIGKKHVTSLKFKLIRFFKNSKATSKIMHFYRIKHKFNINELKYQR